MSYKIMVNTKSMLKEDFLKARKNGIGGSDVAKLCGESRFGSPLTVWLDKTSDEIDLEETNEQYFGNLLEDLVAKEFERRSGLKVRRRNAMYQSVEYPFMIANIDRDIVGEDAFLECVTTNSFQQKAWEEDNIPSDQMLQVQHYMSVLDYDHCYIATLIGNREFKYARVDRDDELVSFIIKLEGDFWNENVLTKTEPEPDGSDFTSEYLKAKYPAAEEKSKMLLDEKYLPLLAKREELAEQIKALEKDKDAIDNTIKNEMGDHETALCGKYRIKWSNVKKTNFDKTKLAPEVYAACCTHTTYRRFEIK